MKGNIAILLTGSLFFIGLLLGMAVPVERPSFNLADVINPLSTLVAAFVGAWAAFRLQAHHRAEEDMRTQIAAGNRALFVLLQQANTLKLYQHDFINPVRESPGRHLELRPTLHYQEDSLLFDLKALDFLATPKHQQTLFELTIEEARYREAIKSINTRSRLHLETIQPTLAALGLRHGVEYTGEQFKAALGDFLYEHLRNLTDGVVMHVDRTVDSLISMKQRLRASLIDCHPTGKFIDFELLQNPPGALQPADIANDRPNP